MNQVENNESNTSANIFYTSRDKSNSNAPYI